MMSITFKEAMGNSGCYTDLNLNDEQYKKIEAASNELRDIIKVEHIVDAAYALITQSEKVSNEAMQLAFESLEKQWENFSLVHPSEPTNLLTTMLVYVCDYLAEKDEIIASILWLTIADIYEYVIEERKTKVLKSEILDRWARSYESCAVAPYVDVPEIDKFQFNLYTDTKLADANHPEVSPQILAKNLSDISRSTAMSLNKFRDIVIPSYRHQSEKLEILWWFEAKYSPSMRKGYRDLKPELNPLIMAVDLCDLMAALPSATSSAYFLAEAVNNLPGSSFASSYDLKNILIVIRGCASLKNIKPFSQLDTTFINKTVLLNLRDLIVAALISDISIENLLQRSMFELTEVTLPNLAKAIFRQEQAIRLCMENNDE